MFALTSLVPLGAFVVFHVLDYARVLFGVQSIGARHAPPGWQLALEALNGRPRAAEPPTPEVDLGPILPVGDPVVEVVEVVAVEAPVVKKATKRARATKPRAKPAAKKRAPAKKKKR